MPGLSNAAKSIKTSLNDLLPEVVYISINNVNITTIFFQAIISTIVHFYKVSYTEAVEHYLHLSLPD